MGQGWRDDGPPPEISLRNIPIEIRVAFCITALYYVYLRICGWVAG